MTRARPHWTVVLFGVVVALSAAAMVLGDRLGGYDHRAMDLYQKLAPPLSAGHLLGADEFGRDVLSRLLTGLRWSVGIATLATALAFAIGTGFGLAAARRASWLSATLRQVTTFTQAFPAFVLAVTVIALVGDDGFWAVVLTLGLVTWPVFARVTYAEGRVLFQKEYVLAAEMMAMPRWRLYLRHVLPGLIPSLSVLVVFHFADMIIAESALSFLGLGAPLGAATWGAMLSDSRNYMFEAPWLLLAPAGAIITLIVSAQLLGRRLREVSQ